MNTTGRDFESLILLEFLLFVFTEAFNRFDFYINSIPLVMVLLLLVVMLWMFCLLNFLS